jgi:hypothetical protein
VVGLLSMLAEIQGPRSAVVAMKLEDYSTNALATMSRLKTSDGNDDLGVSTAEQC